jgi:hypothetical protein
MRHVTGLLAMASTPQQIVQLCTKHCLSSICDGFMYKAYAMILSQAGIQTLRFQSAASDRNQIDADHSRFCGLADALLLTRQPIRVLSEYCSFRVPNNIKFRNLKLTSACLNLASNSDFWQPSLSYSITILSFSSTLPLHGC